MTTRKPRIILRRCSRQNFFLPHKPLRMQSRIKTECPFLEFHQVQVDDWHPHLLLSRRHNCIELKHLSTRAQLAQYVKHVWPVASSAAIDEGIAFISLCSENGHSLEECLHTWKKYVLAVKRAVISHPSSRLYGHTTIAAMLVYGDIDIDYNSVVKQLALAQSCKKN